MGNLNKKEQAAIDAVARSFSANWEQGSGSTDAFIVIAGKRVAVDLRTLRDRDTGQSKTAKLRLRFDKVATRIIKGLQTTFSETVPNGMIVLVTITAPIRLPAKTADVIEHRIKALLGRTVPSRDQKETIHGNHVHIRLVTKQSARAPKLIGFVHNPDSDSLQLLNMTCDLLDLLTVKAGTHTGTVAERWLVVLSAEGLSCVKAYRSLYSTIAVPTVFRKIFMVCAESRVAMLTE